MSPAPEPNDPAQLLLHADWVRRLARQLVLDESAANDLVQETWVVALRKPPAESGNVRAWLGAVVRNLAFERARKERRLTARQRRAAQAEALPSTGELYARASTQRELVGHVLALDEPYRGVVLLRYFEGLDSKAIAERTGVAEATVRSQLARAHAKLRERLERDHGREGWCGVLVALANAPSANVGVSWKLASGLALLVALVAVGVGAFVVGARTEAPSPPKLVETPELDARTGEAWVELETGDELVESAGDETERIALSAGLRGLVLDVDGAPLEGVRIWSEERAVSKGPSSRPNAIGSLRVLLPSSPRFTLRRKLPPQGGANARVTTVAPPVRTLLATTTVDGAFPAIPTQDGTRLVPEREGHRVVAVGVAGSGADAREVAVLAPLGRRTGWVRALDGSPVEGAKVRLVARASALALPFGLESTLVHSRELQADELGAFRFDGVPEVHGGRLIVTAPGHRAATFELDRTCGDAPEAFVLEPAERFVLRGRTVDERGRPVAFVRLQLGHQRTYADVHGRFEFAFDDSAAQADSGERVAELDLVATKPSWRPASLPRARFLATHSAPERELELVLLAGTPSIDVRVLESDGKPAPSVWVALIDAAGRVVDGATASSLLRSSNAPGAWKLDALALNGYRLLVGREESGFPEVVTDPLACDATEVVVRLPSQAPRAALTRRFVDLAGRPLAGLKLEVGFELDTCEGERFVPCESLTTDTRGVAVLEVPSERASGVLVDGVDPSQCRFELLPGSTATDTTLTVAPIVGLTLGAGWGTSARELVFLDAGGARVPVERGTHDATWSAAESIVLPAGVRGRYRVSSRAVTLVMIDPQGGRQTRSIALGSEPTLVLSP
ncbi:MAG: sigma-70 family RNA polymerase sigma factor [Planctomycetes bacterium]|nr:sigma-70 family RNA polymerase sigma factor [Planctomycetota bacterium]